MARQTPNIPTTRTMRTGIQNASAQQTVQPMAKPRNSVRKFAFYWAVSFLKIVAHILLFLLKIPWYLFFKPTSQSAANNSPANSPNSLQPNMRGTVNNHIETSFMDQSGRELSKLHYKEEMVKNQDGSITSYKQAQNVILSTGEAYNASLSVGSNPVMLAGLCAFCGDSLSNARLLLPCCACGKPTCPAHRRKSKYDKGYRCLKCHGRHKWAMRLKPIFYKRVEL